MDLRKYLPGLAVIALLGMTPAGPAQASSIGLETAGQLGPLLNGIDPLGLAGQDFLLTLSLPLDSLPISKTSDSATYSIPGTLNITIGALNFSGFYGNLTLTDPPSGPDTVGLDFLVSELGFVPVVTTTLVLADGTLNGTGLQNYTANVSQPDSTFSFELIGGSNMLGGTLGVTGTTSAFGAPSGVPESGTIALLAGGLLAVILRRRRS